MTKPGAKDIDNVARILTVLPPDEAKKVIREIKNEKDPAGKKRIIELALKKKGVEPL
ncbi:MAG: hypothetical protein WA666_02640 [Nitrospirota bacterium]